MGLAWHTTQVFFSYNALSKFVQESKNDLLVTLFKTINTSNFEQTMKYLALSKDIVEAFGGDPKIIDKIDKAIYALKQSLIDAVKTLHPEHVFTIPEDESISCANFLKGFWTYPDSVDTRLRQIEIVLTLELFRGSIPESRV